MIYYQACDKCYFKIDCTIFIKTLWLILWFSDFAKYLAHHCIFIVFIMIEQTDVANDLTVLEGYCNLHSMVQCHRICQTLRHLTSWFIWHFMVQRYCIISWMIFDWFSSSFRWLFCLNQMTLLILVFTMICISWSCDFLCPRHSKMAMGIMFCPCLSVCMSLGLYIRTSVSPSPYATPTPLHRHSKN